MNQSWNQIQSESHSRSRSRFNRLASHGTKIFSWVPSVSSQNGTLLSLYTPDFSGLSWFMYLQVERRQRGESTMSRTDWDSPHADLDGLTDEGKRMSRELTGKDAPSLQDVLRAAWMEQEGEISVASFSRSELVHLLLPGISERAIETRISKTIRADVEEDEERNDVEHQESVNLFDNLHCELGRTHVAIQKGRTYREPVLVRMSAQKTAPYGLLEVGDRVFLKASAGPVLRVSTVKQLYSFDDACYRTDEILELVEGTELEDDPDFLAYLTDPTSSGNPKNFCTLILFEPWEELQQRVIVHPPRGIGASWVVINSPRKIERYLVGELQAPKRQKQRAAILAKHEEKSDE